MQATHSNNASDLLHRDTTDRNGAPTGPVRNPEPPSALSTPIFLAPIQAARKYMERQRSGGSLPEAFRDGVRSRSGSPDAPTNPAASVSGLYSRERDRHEQDSREQDRRLERSLYEGHSLEAGLNYEIESGAEASSGTSDGRAFLTGGDGTERLFHYAEPYPDPDAATAAVPDPEAVREAIARLTRKSSPMHTPRAGGATPSQGYSAQDRSATDLESSRPGKNFCAFPKMDPPAELPDRSKDEPSATSLPLYNSAQTDSQALPSQAFADVARRVWASESAEIETLAASLPDGRAAVGNGNLQAEVACATGQAAYLAEEGVGLAIGDGRVASPEGYNSHQAMLAGTSAIAVQQGPDVYVPRVLAAEEPTSMARDAASATKANVSPAAGSTGPRRSLVDSERPEVGFEDAALAHDACNLLSALSLYSDLLDVPGVLNPAHRHYAEELKLIAARSQVLVNRLLRSRSPSDADPGRLGSGNTAHDKFNDFGAETPYLQTPKLEVWGLEARNRSLRDHDLRDPAPRDPDSETRERRSPSMALSQPEVPVTQQLEVVQLAPLQPANPTCLATNQQNAGEPSMICSLPLSEPELLPGAQVVAGPVQSVIAVPSVIGSVSSNDNKLKEASRVADAFFAPSLKEDGRQDLQSDVRSGVWSKADQHDSSGNELLPRTDLSLTENALLTAAPHAHALPESEIWPTSLVDLLMRWGSLLSTLAHGTLDVSFGPQAATPVAIAAESLERILVNLVKNARAATINGGAIRIGVEISDAESLPGLAEPVSLEAKSPAASSAASRKRRVVVLTVDDSGCGMSEAEVMQIMGAECAEGKDVLATQTHLDASPAAKRPSGAGKTIASPLRVSDPASVDGANRGSKRGLGLGLRVVRGLVAETGGTLAIHSRLGRGTRIEIRWPSADSLPAVAKTVMAAGQCAAIQSQPETTLVPSSASPQPPASNPLQPTEIGPDGFSEQELRSMMLRLHRTEPSGQGYAQSLLDRRRTAAETALNGRMANLNSTDPAANRAVADRLGPHRVTTDRHRTETGIHPANTDPDITEPETRGAIAC